MAMLSATGVCLLNSSARALSATPPLVLAHSLGSTGAMSWASVVDSPRRDARDLTPVRQTAAFCDAVRTALTMLRGDGKVSPALSERVSLVPTRGEDPR
jgi:hypothetical protein